MYVYYLHYYFYLIPSLSQGITGLQNSYPLSLHPVYLLYIHHAQTSLLDDCAEAHKEYNSLMDKIRTKYKQLDSGEFGSPGIPAFDAEACELAHLLACVSKLCIKLNLSTPKELYRSTVFKHWRHFLDQNSVKAGSLLGCGGCSFVPIDI